jgi:hypothetical protein
MQPYIVVFSIARKAPDLKTFWLSRSDFPTGNGPLQGTHSARMGLPAFDESVKFEFIPRYKQQGMNSNC